MSHYFQPEKKPAPLESGAALSTLVFEREDDPAPPRGAAVALDDTLPELPELPETD